MGKKYHRALGVYGIIGNFDHLVVIKKNGGPYLNRFDLPGGSLEDGESLNQAIQREVREETGLRVIDAKQIGTTSFKYPWNYQHWHFNQHICIFYEIKHFSGQRKENVPQFLGQDSLGALQIELDQLTWENSSPLVMRAKDFLTKGKIFQCDDLVLNYWRVLERPIFKS